jgi:hypothetical protein
LIVKILLLIGFVMAVNVVLAIVNKLLVCILIALPSRFCGVWQKVVCVIFVIINILALIGSIRFGIKVIF